MPTSASGREEPKIVRPARQPRPQGLAGDDRVEGDALGGVGIVANPETVAVGGQKVLPAGGEELAQLALARDDAEVGDPGVPAPVVPDEGEPIRRDVEGARALVGVRGVPVAPVRQLGDAPDAVAAEAEGNKAKSGWSATNASAIAGAVVGDKGIRSLLPLAVATNLPSWTANVSSPRSPR